VNEFVSVPALAHNEPVPPEWPDELKKHVREPRARNGYCDHGQKILFCAECEILEAPLMCMQVADMHEASALPGSIEIKATLCEHTIRLSKGGQQDLQTQEEQGWVLMYPEIVPGKISGTICMRCAAVQMAKEMGTEDGASLLKEMLEAMDKANAEREQTDG